MRLQGLHLLLTYKCNARCRHCFLGAGPERREVLPVKFGLELVDQAREIDSIDHLFIEGGEPFLYPDIMRPIISRAANYGLWIGAVTNGFWAADKDKAKSVLRSMVDAGLRSLSVSTDAWHEEFIPLTRVEAAVEAAKDLDLDVDVMMCRGAAEGADVKPGALKEGLSGVSVGTGNIVCRGRAATAVCSGGTSRWKTLGTCREKPENPGRVHVGPAGEIHLCQGLLLGESLAEKPLAQILSGYDPDKHPVVSRLKTGGPAALAAFAIEHGWRPQPTYVDDCQLCFEVRTHLLRRYPKFIGPPELFSAA